MNITKLSMAVALCALAVSCGHKRSQNPSYQDQNMNYQMGKTVCGSSGLVGEYVPAISNGVCGIAKPVKIKSVGGVQLSTPATVNCKTARALEFWVNGSAKPTAARIDKKLTSMKIAGSYSCRTRNHKKGGKMSEHSFGNAVDISGFGFSDGTVLTVEDAYAAYPAYFKTVQKQACGTFGTVLGPGVRLHDDHFHFDTASYPGGAYCK